MSTGTDLIIIGAGPAGLTAAQYGARANLSVLVLEQLAPGGQVLLIDALENYPGLVSGKSGYELCEILRSQAEGFGAKFLMEEAQTLDKEGGIFTLTLANGKKLSSPAVIVATGAKRRLLDIPGKSEFSGRGVSYCATCDGPFFKGKKIFVAGGGDAACDEAQALSRMTDQVIMVHRRDRFRAQKALAERVLQNPNIEVRFNTVIKEIKGAKDSGGKIASVVLAKTSPDLDPAREEQLGEESAGAVFIFVGSVPQTSFISNNLKLETDEEGYIVTDCRMVSSVPGLFAAGDVRTSSFRQIVTAAGDGAVAAHHASAYIDKLKGHEY